MAEKNAESPTELSPRERGKQDAIRKARRLGYVIFFGTAVIVFLPIAIGAISGLQNDRVWDPFTGEQISAQAADLDCREDAAALLMEAGRSEGLTSVWEQRHRRWVTRCKAEEPAAFSMLRSARNELRRGRGITDDARDPASTDMP